jgi:hypothetical protein
MTLDELQKEWAKDCVIDDGDLGSAAASGSRLHSKYINEIVSAKTLLTKCQLDLATLEALKSKYFRGELTSEELKAKGWEQWHFRTLKTDIPGLVQADEEVQKLLKREQYYKTLIYFLESVLGEIKSRSFAIKAILDWQKFRAGA